MKFRVNKKMDELVVNDYKIIICVTNYNVLRIIGGISNVAFTY